VTVSRSVLTCVACGEETDHELVTVGRLLQSTRCTGCDHVVRHEQRDLMASYLRDLEHRLLTKPQRMLRRARSEPLAFARALPRDLLRQPGKFLAEIRTVLGRD
jgi:hypothetical protein